MAQFLNYSYSKFNPYINSYHNKYNSYFVSSMNNFRKVPSNNIHLNNSLFHEDIENIEPNINYYDFRNDINMPLSYLQKNEKKYKSKSTEQDLDMMKIQLRCDLIGQKINLMQNQIKDFHDSNPKNDNNILRKLRTYNNLKENSNIYGNKVYKKNNFENNNFFKIHNQIKNEKGLGELFRKRRNDNMSHNISYINKNISNSYFPNRDYNSKLNNKVMNNNYNNINDNNNDNYRQSFYNTAININYSNKSQTLRNNFKEKKYNKKNMNKISSNPNIIKPKINNYINDYCTKKKIIHKLDERINQKNIAKTKTLKRNCSQKCFSNNISPNRVRKINDANYNFGNKSNSVASYGSFDQFFINDNNFTDTSCKNYIDSNGNDFNQNNYKYSNNMKQRSLSSTNLINQNKLVIQKGNNFDIINNKKIKNNFKGNNNNYKNEFNINNNKGENSKYCKKFSNLNKTFNSAININNQNTIKNGSNRSIKRAKQPTQINNNFNVNNNTNYYNFNYNQNSNSKNYKKRLKNYKSNDMYNIKPKNNNIIYEAKNNKEIFKENIDENSTNDYMKYNLDYSNDDLINTSDLHNSIFEDKNYNYIKNPSIIYEKKNKGIINTKRTKSNTYN